MIVSRGVLVLVLVAVLASAVPAAPNLLAPANGDADLRRAFSAFIKAKELRFDAVPDLYPGGYARISIYAKRADLGGMIVDEAWFRLVGASLDPEAMRRGELRLLDLRDSAMHVRVSIKSLQEYFQQGNDMKDIELWSDGQYLFGQGTVPVAGLPMKVYLKGSFVVGGTKDVHFHITDLRLNGLPIFSPLVHRWEQQINPVFTQALWPITFNIRGLRMTREGFLVSSQDDPSAPCPFCSVGDASPADP